MQDKKVNKPKRLLTSRKRQYRAVIHSIDKYGDRLLGAVADPEAGMPQSLSEKPIGPFVAELRGDLVEARKAFVLSERAVQKAERREKRAMRGRDKAASGVNRILVALRGAADSIYGSDEIGSLGFAHRTEPTPEGLLEQSVTVTDSILDPEAERPEGVLKTLAVDFSSTVKEELVPATEKLRQAMDEVAARGREVILARHDRNVAMKVYDRAYLWVSRTIESLFQLAGLDDLAAQVRLSERRASGVLSEDGDPSEEEPPPAPQGETAESGSADSVV